MKKDVVIIGVIVSLLFMSIPVAANEVSLDCEVRLPSSLVTMVAQHTQRTWFDITLSKVPLGFDVTNGTYSGWCCEKETIMTRGVNHPVILHCSYDSSMPAAFSQGSWDKINYMLNHRQGSRQSVQEVIWHYSSPGGMPTDADALAMIADAERNGAGFVPQPGQVCAVLVEGVPVIQRCFLELTLRLPVGVGGLVWNDTNADGIQQKGEPGMPDVMVRLFSNIGVLLDSTFTDVHGYYSFLDVDDGDYFIEFNAPAGYRFSPRHQGSDASKDSDVDPLSGRTAMIRVDPARSDLRWDAGMYLPDDTGKPVRPRVVNHPPTADGTAGEPYVGFIGELLRFDGSRSYDRDGVIVSWLWDFGDGTTASEPVFSHVYLSPGVYPVSLTVTDNSNAKDTYVTSARIQVANRPPSAPLLSGPTSGHRNVSYVYRASSFDPEDGLVQYVFSWGDTGSTVSPFFASGSPILTMHQWDAIGVYTISVFARDQANAVSVVTTLTVYIDMHYVSTLGYLMNTKGYGPFDVFVSNASGMQTAVENSGDWYYIDEDGNGASDWMYNIRTGELVKSPFVFGLFEYVLVSVLGVGIVLVLLHMLLVALGKKQRVFSGGSGGSTRR